MAVLKPLIFFLGKILKRDHSIEPKEDICFIKLLGGGSLVIAYPSILGLRKRYPNHTFSLITTSPIAPFAEILNVFDKIYIIDDSSILRLVLTVFNTFIHSFRIDTVIDLEVYSRLSTIFSTLICARNRIGFFLEVVFWRKHFHTHLIFFNRFSGVYHFYDAIAILLKAEPVSISECRKELTKNLGYISKKSSTKRIAIGHGCSELGRERMLSPLQWLKVFKDRIGYNEVAEVILLGGEEDRIIGDRIISKISPYLPNLRFKNFCGKLTPLESIRMLASCDEFWGIDSLLNHFARLLGLKCVSFWGPTDPTTLLRPIPELDEEIYYKKLPCSPCIHVAEEPPCKGNNICIQGIFDNNLTKIPPFWKI